MGDPSTITFLPQISRKSVCLHVCGPISAACEVLARGLQASQIGLYPDCCLTWVDGITGGGHLSRLFTHAPSSPPIYGWNLGSPFVCVCVCVVREVLIYPYFLIKAAKTRYFMWLNVQIVITFTLCALVQKEYKSVDQVSRSEFYPSNLKKLEGWKYFCLSGFKQLHRRWNSSTSFLRLSYRCQLFHPSVLWRATSVLFAACHTGGLAAFRFVYYDIIIFIRREKKTLKEVTLSSLVTL